MKINSSFFFTNQGVENGSKLCTEPSFHHSCLSAFTSIFIPHFAGPCLHPASLQIAVLHWTVLLPHSPPVCLLRTGDHNLPAVYMLFMHPHCTPAVLDVESLLWHVIAIILYYHFPFALENMEG
jgi:hypothetical protein